MTSPTDHGLEQDAITLGGINLAFWLASLGLGKTWPVDFIWSCFPPLLCLLIIVREPDTGVCERRIVGCTLVATWGFRLTHNFVSRGGVGHEDWRYSDMRRTFGRHFWWASLFSVFLGQAAFLFSACMSLYGVLCAPEPLTATDAAGAAVCFGAVLLEAASDLQMDAFVAARREHRTDATVIDRGLWMWSRHPNYLGLCSFGWAAAWWASPSLVHRCMSCR